MCGGDQREKDGRLPVVAPTLQLAVIPPLSVPVASSPPPIRSRCEGPFRLKLLASHKRTLYGKLMRTEETQCKLGITAWLYPAAAREKKHHHRGFLYDGMIHTCYHIICLFLKKKKAKKSKKKNENGKKKQK